MQQTKTYRKYKENSKERFVRYSEGAEMYHVSVSKFMQMAKDAKACYKLGQAVLVNLEIFDRYLETFHIVDDDYYKQEMIFMANRLKPTIRAYLHSDDTDKRYVRLDEMAGKLGFNIDDVKALAVAAGASYRIFFKCKW